MNLGALTDASCGDDEGPLTILLEGDDGDARFQVCDVAAARRLLAAVEPVRALVAAHDSAAALYRTYRDDRDGEGLHSVRVDRLVALAEELA